jgi:hypothetical protein
VLKNSKFEKIFQFSASDFNAIPVILLLFQHPVERKNWRDVSYITFDLDPDFRQDGTKKICLDADPVS